MKPVVQKSFIKLFYVFVLFLLIFTIALKVLALPVQAAPPILHDWVISQIDRSLPIDFEDPLSCVQWNYDGFKCHWKIGKYTEPAWGGEANQIIFQDTRGTGQTVYFAFDSNAVGQFQPTIGAIAWVNGTWTYHFAHEVPSSPAIGNGVELIQGSNAAAAGDPGSLSLRYTGFAGSYLFDGSSSWELTFYVMPYPFTPPTPEIINAKVYLDSTLMNYSASYINTLPDYFSEINRVLAKTTNKIIVWDGQISEKPTWQDAFDVPILGCADNWSGTDDIKIWFYNNDSLFTPDALLWNVGRDCSGYGTIGVNVDQSHRGFYELTNLGTAETSCNNHNEGRNCSDYWRYATSILHEIVHNYGAYHTELYDYSNGLADESFFSPLLNIESDHSDSAPWWNGYYGGDYGHSGFLADPMSSWSYIHYICGGTDCQYPNPPSHSMEEIRGQITLSQLSSDYVNTNNHKADNHVDVLRQIVPGAVFSDSLTNNLTTLDINQKDANGIDVSGGVFVRAWYMGMNGADTIQITDPNNQSGLYPVQSGHAIIPIDKNTMNLYPYGAGYRNYSTILIKSFDTESGSPYGHPVIIDGYNIQLYAFANGGTISSFPLTLTSQYGSANLNAVNGQSGWIQESGTGSGVGGSYSISGNVQTGDTNNKRGFRSIIQFNTSSIPDNAIITGATLSIWPFSHNNSITNFVPLNSYIGSPCFGTCGIQVSDYQASGTSLGTIGTTEGQYNSIDVMPQASVINKTGLTEFKLQFNIATDSDNKGDLLNIYNAGGAHPPTLTVDYSLPE